MSIMQTVFRVKRRLDEKQLSGLQIAKRQRLESDVPILLTFAGTLPENDPRTVASIIRSHQERDTIAPPEKSIADIASDDVEISTRNSSEKSDCVSSSLTDVDELFRIYDAYQKNITNPVAGTTRANLGGETVATTDADTEFVYDIYYLRQQPTSGDASTSILFNEQNFTLQQWDPSNEELVNDDPEGEVEAYEDEDSNAEDNPNNDYPDEEDWYSDNGGEKPHPFDDGGDDDYYGFETSSHLSSIEQQMQDLNFFGREDSD